MNYSNIRKRIANFDDKAFSRKRYAIANEYGIIAFAYGNCEQDALDAAADSGHLDSERMSPDDYNEYSQNGWDDSLCYLGNAGEPFWCEYLQIKEI
jgi:hypothetical protein